MRESTLTKKQRERNVQVCKHNLTQVIFETHRVLKHWQLQLYDISLFNLSSLKYEY